MLNIEIFGQYFVIKTILNSFAATACAFSCITTDTYLVYNSAATSSLTHVLRLFGSFLAWLQINLLNWFQLFFISNELIVHLDLHLYLLILYVFILNCNTINSYRDTGEAIQQAVRIRLHERQCINKAYSKKLIYNLHGYSYFIHGGKTVKNGNETKMEENDTDVNSIIKLIAMHYQLFNALFDPYGMFLRILIYDNSLSSCVVNDSCMNSGSIVKKEYYYNIAKYNGFFAQSLV